MSEKLRIYYMEARDQRLEARGVDGLKGYIYHISYWGGWGQGLLMILTDFASVVG